MAIRKSRESTVIVDGERDEWSPRCVDAMNQAGFKDVDAHTRLFQIRGRYRKATVWGELEITLQPAAGPATVLHMRSTANMDNIFCAIQQPE